MSENDAGQVLGCRCGTMLEVPTLRHLRQLPIVDPPGDLSKADDRSWTYSQGLLFNVGLVIAVLALFTLVYLGRKRSQLPLKRPTFAYQEYVARQVDQWNVSELWEYWTASRAVQLDDRPTPDYLIARQMAKRLDRFLAAAGVFGVLGLAALAAAVLYRPGSPRQ